jgi:hypothetical protein
MIKPLVIVLIVVAPLYAQEFKKVGQAGFVFLEVPVSARSAALAEAGVALSDVRSDAVFTNPAALGWQDKTHAASFSYATWLADTKHYGASYAYNSEAGVFAVNAILFDFGSMPRTQFVSGNRVYEVLGEFKADALAFGVSYARRLTDQFAFGVTLKSVRERIDTYTAGNILFDGGVLYYTGLGSWRVAATIQHFGTETQYISDQFKMPSTLRLGTAVEVINEPDVRLTGMVDASHPTDANERINVGVELSWMNALVLRGGYKFFYDEETYTLGAGLLPQASLPVSADFAFSDYGRLGKIIRFTVSLEMK